MVGYLYERRHTRLLDEFGGLWKSIPVFCGLFLLLVAMSSAGMPGLNGFVGEFTIMLGAYQAMPGYTIIAAAGVILACPVPADSLSKDGAGGDHEAGKRQGAAQGPSPWTKC